MVARSDDRCHRAAIASVASMNEEFIADIPWDDLQIVAFLSEYEFDTSNFCTERFVGIKATAVRILELLQARSHIPVLAFLLHLDVANCTCQHMMIHANKLEPKRSTMT